MKASMMNKTSSGGLGLSSSLKSLRTLYFVARYSIACVLMSAYPTVTHASSVGANPYFAFYAQCAASVSGAQGSNLQSAYTLGSNVQRSLKSCMREARTAQDLLVHQNIQSCLQSNGASLSSPSVVNSSVTATTSPSTVANSSTTALPSSSGVTAANMGSVNPVDLFRACRRAVEAQVQSTSAGGPVNGSVGSAQVQ